MLPAAVVALCVEDVLMQRYIKGCRRRLARATFYRAMLIRKAVELTKRLISLYRLPLYCIYTECCLYYNEADMMAGAMFARVFKSLAIIILMILLVEWIFG